MVQNQEWEPSGGRGNRKVDVSPLAGGAVPGWQREWWARPVSQSSNDPLRSLSRLQDPTTWYDARP